MTDIRVAEFAVPSEGMDTDTVPRLIGPRKAPLIQNFLLDRLGLLVQRGAICEGQAWNLGSAIASVSQWVFDDKVLISRFAATLAAPSGFAANPLRNTTNTMPAVGTPFYYKITTLGATGETTPSAEISTTVPAKLAATTLTLVSSDLAGSLTDNVRYEWAVVAYNASGDLGAVSNFVSAAGDSGGTGGWGASMTWTAVTGATGYRVYRKVAPGVVGLVADLNQYWDRGNGLTFSDNGAVTWTGSAAPVPAPGAIRLTWGAISGATGYRVYRGSTAGGENVYWAPGAVTQYDDINAASTGGTPPNTNTATSGATRDPWTAPYRKAASANQLRGLSLTSRVVDLLDNTSADLVAADANGVPGIRSVRVGNFVYGIAGDSTTTVTQGGAIYKKTNLLRWNGSATPVVYTNGPKAAQDITYHNNRLLVLGGIAQGGTALQFNYLYWSDPLAADPTSTLADTAGAWQDDVSALTNQIVIGSEDSSDFGVAMARVGANLCILKRRSIWMMNGTGPSTWTVKRAASDIGCIDPRSVVEWEDGVFFMSDRGFTFFDGVNVRVISTGLRSTLLQNAIIRVGPTGSDGGFCRASNLGQGYIMVTIGAVDAATRVTTLDDSTWLLYVPTGAWTQIKSPDTIVAHGRTINNTYAISDTRVYRTNYLINPGGAPSVFRGIDSVDGGSTTFGIESRWMTRSLILAAPLQMSELQRIVFEYYWNATSGSWELVATTNTDLTTTSTTYNAGPPIVLPHSIPLRAAFDGFSETDELSLAIRSNGGSPPANVTQAEIHRLLVEYQVARRTRTTP